MTDRRKNPYDPIAHPSLFFRKNDELPVTSPNPRVVVRLDGRSSTELARSVYERELLVRSPQSRPGTATCCGGQGGEPWSANSSACRTEVSQSQPFVLSELMAPHPKSLPVRPKTATVQRAFSVDGPGWGEARLVLHSGKEMYEKYFNQYNNNSTLIESQRRPEGERN